MGQRSDKDLLTLDSKPAMIGGRYRVKLVKVKDGKAVIQVTDMQQPPPLVSSADIDDESPDGTI